MQTLLLVDDEPNIVEGLASQFEGRYGGDVIVLKSFSGLHALSILQNNKVDVVLSDIRMPDMEHAGAQVARAERRAFLRKNIERQLMQGKGLIGITGQSGKHVVPNRTDALAPIDVERVFARRQTDNVADTVVKQMKDVCFLTE